MARTCNASICVLVIMFFAFPFMQRLESVSGTTIVGYSNVSCLESEKKALLQFRQSLFGENLLSSWTGDDCCSWHGVGCSKETGNILKLDLHTPFNRYDDLINFSRYCLRGEINSSLQNLKGLSYLDLSMNCFSGIQIPKFFGSLKNLRYLDLSRSYFEGKVPSHLGNLSRLQHLDLSHNEFEGSIPIKVLTNLTQLTYLDLSSNMFSGSIPSVISNLTQLTHLNLGSNKLIGNQLPSLERLTSLKDFDISFNQLRGVFPSWIGQLSDLETLDLRGNSMAGIISDNHLVNLTRLRDLGLSDNSDVILNFSSTWTPPFQLRWVDLSSCKVGPQFPQWLQNQKQIEYLLMSNGSISDTIPYWFENLYSGVTILDLSYNQVKGNWFERMMLYSRVETLYLNDNQLTGKIILSIPSNLKILHLSNNLLSGLAVANNDATIQNWSLIDLSLSNNRLVGSFPTCLCNMTTLFFIQLSNNQILGELPSCLGNLENLLMVDVTNNTLSGLIPPSLGSLQYLKSLHLHNNKFHGKLPSSFQHLTNLVTLDLAQNAFTDVIPPWIGQTLSNLRLLSLQSNKFHGAIPLQICQLSNLRLLNLAQNNISGCIPSCFGNFTSMVWNHNPDDSFDIFFANISYGKEERILDFMKGTELEYSGSLLPLISSIDLSNNFIVGEIPKELMGLVELLSLNLAGNQIKGRIPEKIGSLRKLFRLDLSRNKLSGPIPQSLSNLSFLSHLNLSFNDLSGRIPTGNQLQTLSDPYTIYMGNNQLCGPPSSNRCPGDQESPDHHNHGKESESEDDDHLLFYSGVGPGLVVGFLGFCGALHFNKSWRYAYFHFFENVGNALAVAIAVKTARFSHKFRKH